MDTIVTERKGRLFLTNTCRVVRAYGDVSEDLASAANFEVERSNPFIKWIVGDFVEADNANSNTQFWTKDDLALGEYSIKYSPLNMLHKQTTPVGFFASTRTINLGDAAAVDEALKKPRKGKHIFVPHSALRATYTTYGPGACAACGQGQYDPDHDGDTDQPGVADTDGGAPAATASLDTASQGSAKIEALSGMWSHVFPFESALVDQADEMSSLFYSMECRGTHLHCAGPNGCDQSFDYMTPEDHCVHLKERTSIRHIVNPTFRGGALIIPPTRPGWKDASARVIEESLREEASRYAEQTEQAFNQANTGGADLSTSAWEQMMQQVLRFADNS